MSEPNASGTPSASPAPPVAQGRGERAGAREQADPLGIDAFLAEQRQRLQRVAPAELPGLQASGAFIVDVRSQEVRCAEGHLPGAIVIDRLALEWRLDPGSGHAIEDGPGWDDVIVVVCTEGYASSLAAGALQRIGFTRATDLIGGFRGYVDAGLPVEDQPTRIARYPLPRALEG